MGITCLLIASKLEEIIPPSVSNLVYITDYAYNCSDVLDMERTILHTMSYMLTAVTPLRILEMVRAHTLLSSTYPPVNTPQALHEDLSKGVWHLAGFLMELAITEYAEVRTPASVLCAAALLLAVHMYEVPSSKQITSCHIHGNTGPALTSLAGNVWEALGSALDSRGNVSAGMKRVGAVMCQIFHYHSRAQPQFPSCKKYSAPQRMAVSLVQGCSSFMLPDSVVVGSVTVKLCNM